MNRAISTTKEFLEHQISHNTKSINANSDKISSHINPRLDDLAAKITRGAHDTAQLQKEVNDSQDGLRQTAKKANQNQTHISAMLEHLGVRFNEANELEFPLQGSDRNGLSSNSPSDLHSQIKTIHLEIKNMTNKLPLVAKQVTKLSLRQVFISNR